MTEARHFLHFNSCVYEMTKKGDQYSPLMKQKNNAIIFESVFLGTVVKPEGEFNIDSFSDELFSSLGDLCTPELMEHKTVYSLYPISDPASIDTDFIVVYGVALKDIPPDMYAPIPTTGNPDDNFAAIEKALQPKYKRELVMIFVPMTGRYMFDLSVSDVPVTAITVIDEAEEVPSNKLEETFGPSLTLDPMMPTLSEEEKEILKKFEKYIDDMRQGWLHSDMTLEEAEAKEKEPLNLHEIAEAIGVDVDALFDIIARNETIAKSIASKE